MRSRENHRAKGAPGPVLWADMPACIPPPARLRMKTKCAHEIRRIYICSFQPQGSRPECCCAARLSAHSSPDRYCKCRSNRAVVHRQAIRFFQREKHCKPKIHRKGYGRSGRRYECRKKSAGRFRHHQHAGYQFRFRWWQRITAKPCLRGKQSVPRQPDGCHQGRRLGRSR